MGSPTIIARAPVSLRPRRGQRTGYEFCLPAEWMADPKIGGQIAVGEYKFYLLSSEKLPTIAFRPVEDPDPDQWASLAVRHTSSGAIQNLFALRWTAALETFIEVYFGYDPEDRAQRRNIPCFLVVYEQSIIQLVGPTDHSLLLVEDSILREESN